VFYRWKRSSGTPGSFHLEGPPWRAAALRRHGRNRDLTSARDAPADLRTWQLKRTGGATRLPLLGPPDDTSVPAVHRRDRTDRHFVVGRACASARDVVSQQNDGAGAPVPFPEMLTVEEAAAFLRVNRKTLYEAVRLGSVPGVVRLGRTIRISRSALIGWVQGNGSPALGEKQ